MIRILWILTGMMSIAGLALALSSFGMAGAPQQGAVAAVGVALAVCPYVFVRALEGLFGDRATKRLVDAIQEQQRAS